MQRTKPKHTCPFMRLAPMSNSEGSFRAALALSCRLPLPLPLEVPGRPSSLAPPLPLPPPPTKPVVPITPLARFAAPLPKSVPTPGPWRFATAAPATTDEPAAGRRPSSGMRAAIRIKLEAAGGDLRVDWICLLSCRSWRGDRGLRPPPLADVVPLGGRLLAVPVVGVLEIAS